MRLIHFPILLSLLACKEKSYLPCPDQVFRQALRQAESGGNDKLLFTESDGNLSAGRYQLSLSDKQIYGCDFNSMADLFNGEKQEQCLTLIFQKLDKLYPSEPWDIRYARYFGTMRSRNNPYWKDYFVKYPTHNGYVNLQKEALALGCKIQ